MKIEYYSVNVPQWLNVTGFISFFSLYLLQPIREINQPEYTHIYIQLFFTFVWFVFDDI